MILQLNFSVIRVLRLMTATGMLLLAVEKGALAQDQSPCDHLRPNSPKMVATKRDRLAEPGALQGGFRFKIHFLEKDGKCPMVTPVWIICDTQRVKATFGEIRVSPNTYMEIRFVVIGPEGEEVAPTASGRVCFCGPNYSVAWDKLAHGKIIRQPVLLNREFDMTLLGDYKVRAYRDVHLADGAVVSVCSNEAIITLTPLRKRPHAKVVDPKEVE